MHSSAVFPVVAFRAITRTSQCRDAMEQKFRKSGVSLTKILQKLCHSFHFCFGLGTAHMQMEDFV